MLIRWLKELFKKTSKQVSSKNENKYEELIESININPIIEKELTTSYRDYHETSPRCISLPPDGRYYETSSGKIGYLNYQTYSFSAKFIQTNRMRTNKIIDLFDDCDIETEIRKLGYTDPINYEVIAPEAASEAQLEYLNDLIDETSCDLRIPKEKLCWLDASYIIDYIKDGGHIPSIDIINYATELHIKLSYCAPDWIIYTKIFESLTSIEDKIAFFIFCVYRDQYKPDCENPNKSAHKELFYSFAELYKSDTSFLKSFTQYYAYKDGIRLVHFGENQLIKYNIHGGSKRTMAYKTAITYLADNL